MLQAAHCFEIIRKFFREFDGHFYFHGFPFLKMLECPKVKTFRKSYPWLLALLYAAMPHTLSCNELDDACWRIVALNCKDPLRIIQTQRVDLTSLFTWATNKNRESIVRPAEYRWEFFSGEVNQILDQGGIIVRGHHGHDPFTIVRYEDKGTRKLFYVANHPLESRKVDGDPISGFAFETGRFRYTTTAGAIATVESFNYGTLAPKREIDELTAQLQTKAESEQRERETRIAKARSDFAEARRLREQESTRKIVAFQKKQAEAGLPLFQYELGMRYLKGDGVETNRTLGIEWLSKSASNGNAQAKKALETLPKN